MKYRKEQKNGDMDAMENRALWSKNLLSFRGSCSSSLLGVFCCSHLVDD